MNSAWWTDGQQCGTDEESETVSPTFIQLNSIFIFRTMCNGFPCSTAGLLISALPQRYSLLCRSISLDIIVLLALQSTSTPSVLALLLMWLV